MRKKLFKEFLKFYWLRPEVAIFCVFRALGYRESLKYFGDGGKALDVSCGDGVFSFITHGGVLSIDSDMFRALNNKCAIKKEHFDHYDHFDDNYFVKVVKRPEIFFHYGTDYKENLLKKAEKLEIYKELKFHDNNNPLFFQDESLEYIYTNSVHWVPKLDQHLNDLVRILKPGGKLVIEFISKEVVNFTSPNYAPFMGDKFHEMINAGRLHTWKGLVSKDDFMDKLKGLEKVEIEKVEPVAGDCLGQIWDIGLRPLFNPLAKMANSISLEERSEIKEEWISIVYNLFEDFVENYQPSIDDSFKTLVVLSKK